MRTLIVEDDVSIQNLLKRILGKYGDCRLTLNGLEAVEQFENALKTTHSFDLICMDIKMPKLGGLEALQQIRRIEKQNNIPREREVKVIMTTGLSESKDVIDALYKGGASAYFVKPIEIKAFMEEVQRLGLIQAE